MGNRGGNCRELEKLGVFEQQRKGRKKHAGLPMIMHILSDDAISNEGEKNSLLFLISCVHVLFVFDLPN